MRNTKNAVNTGLPPYHWPADMTQEGWTHQGKAAHQQSTTNVPPLQQQRHTVFLFSRPCCPPSSATSQQETAEWNSSHIRGHSVRTQYPCSGSLNEDQGPWMETGRRRRYDWSQLSRDDRGKNLASKEATKAALSRVKRMPVIYTANILEATFRSQGRQVN